MNGAFPPNRVLVSSNSLIMLMASPISGRDRRGASAGLALGDRRDLAPRSTGVELPRTADLLVGIGNHLVPLRDPADGARQGEDRRKQAHRDPDRALHD